MLCGKKHKKGESPELGLVHLKGLLLLFLTYLIGNVGHDDPRF